LRALEWKRLVYSLIIWNIFDHLEFCWHLVIKWQCGIFSFVLEYFVKKNLANLWPDKFSKKSPKMKPIFVSWAISACIFGQSFLPLLRCLWLPHTYFSLHFWPEFFATS
jgi:hypothetical protein